MKMEVPQSNASEVVSDPNVLGKNVAKVKQNIIFDFISLKFERMLG